MARERYVYIQNLSTGEVTRTRRDNIQQMTQSFSEKFPSGVTKTFRPAERLLTAAEVEVLLPIQNEITHLIKTTQSKHAQNFQLAKRELRGRMQTPKVFLQAAEELLTDMDTTEDETKRLKMLQSWCENGIGLAEPGKERIVQLQVVLRGEARKYIQKMAVDAEERKKQGIIKHRKAEKEAELEIEAGITGSGENVKYPEPPKSERRSKKKKAKKPESVESDAVD